MIFKDRRDAGERLAEAVERHFRGEERAHHAAPLQDSDCMVYAIPRGGVVLGVEVARKLGCPLDLVITRKVGHPSNPEYALCVVAEDGHEICNEEELSLVDSDWLREEKQKEREEAKRRRLVYLGGRPRPRHGGQASVAGKTAIVVDDGIATGMTFIAALREVRELQPARLVAAVPVMPAEFLERLKKECDEVVCLNIDPAYLGAVGAYYKDFPQVTDEEVVEEMRNSWPRGCI